MTYTYGDSLFGDSVTIFEHDGNISITAHEKYKDKNKKTKTRTAQAFLTKETILKIVKQLTEFTNK